MVISSTSAVDVSIQAVSPVLSVGVGVCAKALGAKMPATKVVSQNTLPGRRDAASRDPEQHALCRVSWLWVPDRSPAFAGHASGKRCVELRISSPRKISAISGSVADAGKRRAAMSGRWRDRAQKVGAAAFRLRGAVASTRGKVRPTCCA